jgi:hypothetical protein
MACRILSREDAQNGKNGLTGHPAKSFVGTSTIHPSASQPIHWIKIYYYIPSNCKYNMYGDHDYFRCQPRRMAGIECGANGVSCKGQRESKAQKDIHMPKLDAVGRTC